MEIILSALKDKEHYQVVEGTGALNCFSSNHNDATHVLFGTMKHFVGLIAARIFRWNAHIQHHTHAHKYTMKRICSH